MALVRLPDEILVEIAFQTALLDFLGPPCHLVSLLCVSKSLHNRVTRTNDLMASIFKAKFDITAPRRRLGPGALLAKNLPPQLRTYCTTLQRLKAGDIYAPTVEDDLLTAWIMMTENDGKNAAHLRHWASLRTFMERFVVARLWEGQTATGWPLDNKINSLALWLLWMTSDYQSLRTEPTDQRQQIIRLVTPFVVAAFRYSAFNLPDLYFHNDIDMDDLPFSVPTAHGPYPHYPTAAITEIVHFGRTIGIYPPILSAAANLVWFSRVEIGGFQPPPNANIPSTRQEAVALGYQGATLSDYVLINSQPHAKLLDCGAPDWRRSLSPSQLKLEDKGWQVPGLKARSAKFDNDWERAMSFLLLQPVGPVYTLGLLSGRWIGRMVAPMEGQYMALMANPNAPTFTDFDPFLASKPLFVRIREHHAVAPNKPFPCDDKPYAVDDGIRNAWLRTPCILQEKSEKRHLKLKCDDEWYQYDTYTPGEPVVHDASVCARCVFDNTGLPIDSDDDSMDYDDSLDSVDSSSDDGQWPDSAEYDRNVEEIFREAGLGRGDNSDVVELGFQDPPCDGSPDVMFTGETEEWYGDAWGAFRFYGRVRKCDGLIALVRSPARMWGTWILRGYIHAGENFTGKMRLYPSISSAVVVGDSLQHTAYIDPRTCSRISIVAGNLFDPYTLLFISGQVITVSERSGLVLDVSPLSESSVDFNSTRVIDLRDHTVLPGLVDAHVHFFLHPYDETAWEDQVLKETLVERTVRATNHARTTLLAGFTTVRDLGTEGALDADVAFRKCLSGPKPLIPGPRYFCANRAIVSTGSYGPKGTLHVNQEGVEGITGADVADGVEECRKVVRRQIGAGADWIKVYADYRARSRIAEVSSESGRASNPIFTTAELKEIIDTAHSYGVKVAAHATNSKTTQQLIDCHVDSIEHGYNLDNETLQSMRKEGVVWVPTLAAYETVGDKKVWARAQDTFRRGLAAGVRIACGGDTGVFAHGANSRELALMVECGADPWQVLQWATLGGWECVRSSAWEGAAGRERIQHIPQLAGVRSTVGDNEVPFGVIRRGFSADIIATTGDLTNDFRSAMTPEKMSFVMKGGKVFKMNGQATF
ncbi:hypothetical protein BD410DRAFT_739450, partial [Rickenella mellea]